MAKSQADRIYDAIRDPEVDLVLSDGEIAGEKVDFIMAPQDEDDEDQDVPIALILDKRALKLLKEVENAILEDDEDHDQDGDEAERNDEDEAPTRRGGSKAKGRKFTP